MSQLDAIELKAFVPAKRFKISKRFYQDLGFTLAWCADDLAYLRLRTCSFLLQDASQKEVPEALTMHLLVPDADVWYDLILKRGIIETYGVQITPLVQQPWGMREFTLTDPSGVQWRIAQNID